MASAIPMARILEPSKPRAQRNRTIHLRIPRRKHLTTDFKQRQRQQRTILTMDSSRKPSVSGSPNRNSNRNKGPSIMRILTIPTSGMELIMLGAEPLQVLETMASRTQRP